MSGSTLIVAATVAILMVVGILTVLLVWKKNRREISVGL